MLKKLYRCEYYVFYSLPSPAGQSSRYIEHTTTVDVPARTRWGARRRCKHNLDIVYRDRPECLYFVQSVTAIHPEEHSDDGNI